MFLFLFKYSSLRSVLLSSIFYYFKSQTLIEFILYSSVAEHMAVNHRVVGSIPTEGGVMFF